MSGGKEAQLAFHYQNIITVLKILNGLHDGKLISVKVEQKVPGSAKEIDIVLEFSGGRFEYHEVKSGEGFTNNGIQIKECLKSLFLLYQSRPTGEQSTYSVIINPDFLPPIATFAGDIRRFSQNKTVTSSFRAYCITWEIEANKIIQFHTFMKSLSLDHEMNLSRLKVEVLASIESITADFFMNADHALPREDLLNRLVSLIIISIEKNSGVIDIQEFADTIIDWSARNAVAYQTAIGNDVKGMLEAVKSEITIKLQAKFPSVAIAPPSPSPSASISEDQI
ncbi:MAG TPA: hypothetical protein VLF89_07050 [Candidatus Saccharimonadales bacterium]|nr:hypothetical protein [Candidatus Saccharimonadales bacterium]